MRMAVLRVLPFALGLLILVVGVGNILVGVDKVAQYEELIRERARQAPASRMVAATALDGRQAATLLHPLRQGGGSDQTAVGKLAFYRVVTAGGWTLTGIGLACCGFGFTRHRRQMRLNPGSRSD